MRSYPTRSALLATFLPGLQAAQLSAQSYGLGDEVLTLEAAAFRPATGSSAGYGIDDSSDSIVATRNDDPRHQEEGPMGVLFLYRAFALAFLFSVGTMLGQSAQDRVKTIAAVSFAPWNSQMAFDGSGIDRIVSASPGTNLGLITSLELPEGSLVTGLGIEGCNVTMGGFMIASIQDSDLTTYPPDGVAISFAQGCGTAYAPVTGLVYEPRSNTYAISIYLFGSGPASSVRAVRVYYRTGVGPPPAAPSFNDVPATDPAFQFIEALAASGITAGCGGGNYCPDATLTRRQMAVFLAKGLGLGWPAP